MFSFGPSCAYRPPYSPTKENGNKKKKKPRKTNKKGKFDCSHFSRLCGNGELSAAGTLGRTELEAIFEAPGDGLEVTHASGTGGLSPLRLLGPVVCDTMSDSGFRAVARRVDNVHLRTLAAGYPQDEQVLFWMWKERRPQRRQSVCDLFCEVVRMGAPFI